MSEKLRKAQAKYAEAETKSDDFVDKLKAKPYTAAALAVGAVFAVIGAITVFRFFAG